MNSYTFFWIALAVLFGAVEATTTNLTTIWFAVASALMAFVSLLNISAPVQLVIFALLVTALLVLTRPLVDKLLVKKTIATNADRVISQTGIVLEDIDAVENTGQVKVLGQCWSAKSENGESIAKGTQVTVTSLEGVKVVVRAIATPGSGSE